MLPRLCLAALLASCVAATAAERPVVVELFTSEGCSSCPPADALLTELAQGRPDVLPLAFHVTYWNGLGWTDPFSLAVATERQAAYGARFGDGSYTPELGVEGVQGVVGSDRQAVEGAITGARRAMLPGPTVHLTRQDGGVSIAVAAGSGSGRLLLVGFDTRHRTSVGRGENGGRMLTESNIVRSVRDVGAWDGRAITLAQPAPAGEDAAVLVVVPGGRIVGAARLGG